MKFGKFEINDADIIGIATLAAIVLIAIFGR
jgi:hypothetical protein